MNTALVIIFTLLLVIILFLASLVASGWKKEDRLKEKINDTILQLDSIKFALRQARDMNDRFYYNVFLKVPTGYCIDETCNCINVQAVYENIRITIKPIPCQPDDNEDREFAIREAEELIDKLQIEYERNP